MGNEDVKKGQQIAESIRKVLLNVDLRLVYAEGELRLAQEDFKIYSKLGGQSNTRRALKAKARSECFRVFLSNINKAKGEITMGLDAVLSRYTPKYKRIWVMYFLEQASIDEICTEVAYSRENVNKIVQRLKLDLCHHYRGGIQDEWQRNKRID